MLSGWIIAAVAVLAAAARPRSWRAAGIAICVAGLGIALDGSGSTVSEAVRAVAPMAVFLSVAWAQVVPRSQPTIVYRTMKIPAGTNVYIGPPAKPIPKQLSDAIGTELGKIPDILEAHLPMVYIKGQIDPPAQVLVIVLEENSRVRKRKSLKCSRLFCQQILT